MLNRSKALLDGFLEVLESLGLFICLVLAAPMGVFRRLDRLYAGFYYLIVLLPRNLIAPLIRVQLDSKIGNYLQAANLLDQITLVLEDSVESKKHINVNRILCDFYCMLFRLYVLSGNIEDAALTVIRAHQKIGMDKLPSTPNFDVKVAHVVKAGIAAGKLLEDGGLATLMVRTGEEQVLSKSSQYKKEYKSRKVVETEDGAKIIPFPRP